LGPEGIVYEDKAISTINSWQDSFPKENSRDYVANGEIGIAIVPLSLKKNLKTEITKRVSKNFGS